MSKLLRAALSVAVAAGAFVGSAAHAAIYNSHFDPIAAVTFVGDGTFYVDDACLVGDAILSGPSCHAQLMSADVDLTVTATSDTGHLDFGPSNNIYNVVIENGELVGVNSALIGFVFPTSCTGVVCGTPWWIRWVSESSDPVYLTTGSCASYRSTPKSVGGPYCHPDDEPVGAAFDVTFTRIPEPGTLALLGGGLLAAVGIRRRRTGR